MNVCPGNSTGTNLCASLCCLYNFGECVCKVFNLIWWQRLFEEECWSIFEGMTAWTFTFQANSSWIWKTISLNVFSPIWFPWKQIIWNLKLVPPHFSLSLNQTNHNSLASRKKTLDWLINKSQSMWLVLKIH